jgi:8-oxo-dGTP pyrophosphatase MutT (NUDIX family)
MPKQAAKKQIAALPYRKHGDGIEVLLITSRETRRWVIPKGWPMRNKADFNAAQQEAFEEAGIEGKMSKKSMGSYIYNKRKKSGRTQLIQVTVYAMEVSRLLDKWPEQGQRNRRWFAVNEAVELVQEDGLKAIVEAVLA